MDIGFKLLLLLIFVVAYNGIICQWVQRIETRVKALEERSVFMQKEVPFILTDLDGSCA